MARGDMSSAGALGAGTIDAGAFAAGTAVGLTASGVREETAGGETDAGAASWIDPITGWRADLTRRLRVLLHAEPLLTLRANDGRVAEELKHYDSLTLVFRLFDLLIEHTGIDVGLSAPDVRDALTPLLSAMDSAAGIAPEVPRHDAVVDRVLGALLNDAARREKFAGHYCAVGPDGEAAEVVFHYRLLEEVHREGDGEIVLRLTNEAINLYIGALDREIEDEQAAAEQVIHEQLQRGSFARAVQTARDALFQSRRYSEKIDRVLDLTRRDVRQADWRTEVPALLSAAGEHLTRRISAERAILGTVDEQMLALKPGSNEALQVGQVRSLVRQCADRHSDLATRVFTARQVFLREQGRQGFPEAVAAARPTLPTDVLEPMLALPVVQAVTVGDAALRAIAPATPRPLLTLDQLIERMLQPRREVLSNAVGVANRDMTDLPPELQHYSPVVRAQAEHILASLPSPTTLSAVLADLLENDAADAVGEFLVLRVLHLFDPDGETSVPVRARPLGTRFEVRGIVGDDLLLTPLLRATAQSAHAAVVTAPAPVAS